MTVRLVADVGNTRIKWGLCAGSDLRVTAVAPDDPASWAAQLKELSISGPAEWAVAGVHPGRRDRFATWLRERGATVRVVADYGELPLRVDVAAPERVGIDRLLNAVAAGARVPAGMTAVIIDAGSAVTVDLLDADGVFRGGSIFPGLRLMAHALHEHTAALPFVDDFAAPEFPGRDTVSAIRGGIFHAVCGGVDRLVERLTQRTPGARVFLAGGSTEIAAGLRCRPDLVGPALTLEGLRLTAWPES